MPKISTTVATLLLGLVVWKVSLWNVLPSSEKFWTGLAGVYAILIAATGWGYVIVKLKLFGWIHASLMLGVAVISAYFGSVVLKNPTIAGGSGPDANPVGGIIYAIGFLYCLLALITGICGIGVIKSVLDDNKIE